MNFSKSYVLLFASFLMLLSFSSFGQNSPKQGKSEFSIEIDPATFVFSGYGIHLRWKPKNSEHLLLGIGVYAMDFPELLINLNPNNKNKSWELRLNRGLGTFGEYHFSAPNRKWFVGTQIGLQEYEISTKNENQAGNERFTNALFMGYGGYTWRIFNDKFYLKPWGGIGYTSKIGGSNTLNNQEYDIAPITMFATLHVGYHF